MQVFNWALTFLCPLRYVLKGRREPKWRRMFIQEEGQTNLHVIYNFGILVSYRGFEPGKSSACCDITFKPVS
jgi:hypothetical protein